MSRTPLCIINPTYKCLGKEGCRLFVAAQESTEMLSSADYDIFNEIRTQADFGNPVAIKQRELTEEQSADAPIDLCKRRGRYH